MAAASTAETAVPPLPGGVATVGRMGQASVGRQTMLPLPHRSEWVSEAPEFLCSGVATRQPRSFSFLIPI